MLLLHIKKLSFYCFGYFFHTKTQHDLRSFISPGVKPWAFFMKSMLYKPCISGTLKSVRIIEIRILIFRLKGINMENKKIWIETASDLLEIQNKIKYLKTKQQMTANILKSLSGDNGQSIDGFTFKPLIRKGSVKYNKIPILKTINLDDFRGQEVKVWKLMYEEQFNI